MSCCECLADKFPLAVYRFFWEGGGEGGGGSKCSSFEGVGEGGGGRREPVRSSSVG